LHNSKFKQWAVGLSVAACSAFSSAAQYSEMFVFGDSLSDTGNLQAVLQNPNVPARFTDGFVAVEILAQQLGLPLTTSLHLLPPDATGGIYGNNFAVASAVALDEDGDFSTPDIHLPTQVNSFLKLQGGVAPSDALYVVMIGGNDIFAARDIVVEGDWGAGFNAAKRITQATQSVDTQLRTLIEAGAKHLIVVNTPDLGASPNTTIKAEEAWENAETIGDLIVAFKLNRITRRLARVFNTQIAFAVSDIYDDTQVDIIEYNLYELFDDILKNYEGYGYTNKDEACISSFNGGVMHPDCNFETFVFFDETHPTGITHERAGFDMLKTLNEAK